MRNRHQYFGYAVSIGLQLQLCACSRSQNVELAKTVTLRPHQALVLVAPKPLLMVGLNNRLCLEVIPPDSINWRLKDGNWGVRRSDGVLITVGIALLHSDSSSDTISAVGYDLGGHGWLTVSPSVHESVHPPFTGVRISVSDSLTVSKVKWWSWTGP